MDNLNKKTDLLLWGILCWVGLTMGACTKNYKDINTPKNAIATVGPAELPFLFSKAIESVPWNEQVSQNLYADQYAQYFANDASYFATDRYVIVMDWLQRPWTMQYTGVVPQLQTIFERTDSTSAEYALANIWWVYSFSRITDYWGPIPYFKAGVPGTSVPYDAQDKIYNDFFKRLEAAVDVLKENTDKHPFGSYDLMYGGDVNKWIKFANTLRLRLALRLSDVDPGLAQKEAEAAVASGVMTKSPDDDALVEKNLLDHNDLSIMSTYNHEFSMSAAMESALKGYKDPRMPVYFLPAVKSGTFEGIRNGLTVEQLAAPINSKETNSKAGPRWSPPDQGGIADFLSTPANVMFPAEAYFLRAEGALLGWDMGGTPKELYEAGIRNSMIQWGITDEAVIAAYINSTATPVAPQDYLDSRPLAGIPVKFNATDKTIQLQQIAMQEWLALYPDGWEAWATFRRRHVLPLYPVANSDNPDIPAPSETQYIRRVPFLLSEYNTNGDAVNKATELLGGPDKITTPLWWDTH